MKDLSIGIVGGGIGGLLLAQALQKRSVPSVVFERDAAPSFRSQGYRVTIHPEGVRWLERCLPGPAWRQFRERSATWGGFRVTDAQLRPLVSLSRRSEEESSRSIDRQALREVLLKNAPFSQVDHHFWALCAYAAVLLPVSLFAFASAVRRATRDGTLLQF